MKYIARLAWLAGREGVSLNTLVCSLLAEGAAQCGATRLSEPYQAAGAGGDAEHSGRVADAPAGANDGARDLRRRKSPRG